jgi:hypothetical protein
MRRFLSKHVARRAACAAVFVLSLFVGGCNPNLSRNEVTGLYVMEKQGGNRITLTLSSDGVFNEEIRTPGNLKFVAGTWSIRGCNVDFDKLWIPQTFAPQKIVEADKQAGERQPKYTDPRHWDLPVEKSWGRVKIEVFPDDHVEFVMVS